MIDWIFRWMDGLEIRWVDGGWMGDWLGDRLDGGLSGWVGGWMDGWVPAGCSPLM